MLHTHLDNTYDSLVPLAEVDDWREVQSLRTNVDRVWIGECSLQTPTVALSLVSLQIHIYQPSPSASSSNLMTNGDDDDDGGAGGDDSGVSAATIVQLPAVELEGVWDSLVYEGQVKERLLGYIYSTILFGDAAVDFNIVTWNRVVLLHGPPGTGKTSLCRALAQKLSIRLSDRYDRGQLVEINSHSLFSKWFSESGKLVQKLFAGINDMVDDEQTFVVVLIDEVESLTAARAGAMSGKEPSDALRVVNALLTQLDKLKHRKNCLVMTTSNLSGAIDVAFIDRADIKQYIGLPPAQAVYWILQSCLKEIMRAGLIPPVLLHDWQAIELFRSTSSAHTDRHRKCSSALYDLAFLCHAQKMSGRTLRRLPVLSHARFIGMTLQGAGKPEMEVWLSAMSSSSPCPTMRFPPEVVSLIVEQVRLTIRSEREAIGHTRIGSAVSASTLACALVSREWADASIPHLYFPNLELDFSFENYQSLVVALERNAWCLPLVRRVEARLLDGEEAESQWVARRCDARNDELRAQWVAMGEGLDGEDALEAYWQWSEGEMRDEWTVAVDEASPETLWCTTFQGVEDQCAAFYALLGLFTNLEHLGVTDFPHGPSRPLALAASPTDAVLGNLKSLAIIGRPVTLE
ncbi:hypothetical protein RQP46_009042 [Phenoliferia psychrophenolica]